MKGEHSLENVRTIIYNITIEDLNAIKKIRGLASRKNNTYISFFSDGIYDMAGLNLTEIPATEGKQVKLLIPDTSNPQLLSFTLNLTTEVLCLTFDETVSYESLVLSRFAIQSSADSDSISLSESSTVSENDSTIIYIYLSRQDLNRIKLDTSIAVNLTTTQLVVSEAAIEDMSKQKSIYQVLNASDFYPDTMKPQLETFLFDLNSGLIILNFNEAINADSVEETLLTFLNAPNGSVLFNPKDLVVNSSNGPQLRLRLTDDDLNLIKQYTSLLTEMSNSYVNLYGGFVKDMNNNPLVEITGEKARNVTEDETRPLLESFDFDLNEGTMTLYFSETVNATTFNAVGITLQSRLFAHSSEQHQLSGGYLQSLIDDTTLTLVLTDDDLNDLKALGIALFNTTTWLTMENYTVLDMSNNPAIPIQNSTNAKEVEVYTEDEIRPRLLNFTLDLTHEILVLTFSETVDVYTLNTTQFTIVNSDDDYASSNHTLSSLSYQSSPHGPTVNVTLDDYDLNQIKKLTNLGTSTSDTYLSMTAEAVEDRSGNPAEAAEKNNSVRAGSVIEDIHHPLLTEFLFDLNRGEMLLTFTETINASSIRLSDFALLSTNSSKDPTIYNLTGGYILSMDGPVVLVELSVYDLNEIKLLRKLASGSNDISNNTFLTVKHSAVKDNEGNTLVGIYKENPLPATEFISDITSPELEGFDLDLNTGILTLNFTEAVDGDSLIPEGLQFLSLNSSNPASSYQLTNGSVVSVEQNWIEVNLTVEDLNELKVRLNLATDQGNTYISFEEGSITDTSNNPSVGVNESDAIPVNILTPDTTRPTLESFTLDLNSGEMNLTYSETVLPSTLTSTAFTVQNAMSLVLNNPDLYYTLAQPNVTVTRTQNTVVSVVINNADLNEIKRRPELARSENDTFLSYTKEAINDTNMNPVSPRYPNNAIQASEYVKDTTPPELSGFDFDLNTGQLTLRFTETVNRTTLQTDYLVFKSDDTPNATNYTLTGDGSSFVP